jgi:hypothetical protein
LSFSARERADKGRQIEQIVAKLSNLRQFTAIPLEQRCEKKPLSFLHGKYFFLKIHKKAAYLSFAKITRKNTVLF